MISENSKLTKPQNLADLKFELKSWFTKDSYSKLLGTNSLFYKVFWLFIVIISNYLLLKNAVDNINLYLRYDIITKVEIIEVSKLNFPAVNICNKANKDIDRNNIISCRFDKRNCGQNEFKNITTDVENTTQVCIQFNGVNNTDILATTRPGLDHGLQLGLYANHNRFKINIGDNFVLPLDKDFDWFLLPGNAVILRITRMVSEKLEKPYSPCVRKPSPNDYPILAQMNPNFKYRKSNCLNFVHRMNMSNSLCPQECDSIDYGISAQTLKFSFTLLPKDQRDAYKQKVSKLSNGTNMSESEITDPKLTVLYVYYNKLSYEKNSQSAKTCVSDLISNLGGLLGLFIELSFISFFRCFEFILKTFI